MEKIDVEHGGEFFDQKYPEGIPTSIRMELINGESFESEFIMYPSGHARN